MRKQPNKEQAEGLYKYFERRFLTARWSELTSEQLREARDNFRNIHPVMPEFERELHAWTVKHIPSELYSKAIRAVNKTIKRRQERYQVDGETTITIKKSTKLALENVGPQLSPAMQTETKDGLLQVLLRRNQALRQLEKLSMDSFDDSGDELIAKLNALITFYQENDKS